MTFQMFSFPRVIKNMAAKIMMTSPNFAWLGDVDGTYIFGLSSETHLRQSESFMVEGKELLHFPFPTNLEDNFMSYRDNDLDFVSLDLGKPKDVEVDKALSIVVGHHSFGLSRDNDVLLYGEKCLYKIMIH